MSWVSATIMLFLVMDPFGNIPFFLTTLQQFPEERRRAIIIRELLIALVILVLLLFIGPHLLSVLRISQSSLRIAGGLVLILISVGMIFGGAEKIFNESSDGEPFIVPLAVPYVAGPCTSAVILLLAGNEPHRKLAWLTAIFCAWLASATILLFSTMLANLLGKKVLSALQRLMGLLLTAIAVEMLISGIQDAIL